MGPHTTQLLFLSTHTYTFTTMATPTPNLEVVYFNMPGRAQPIRDALKLGKIQYEDKFVSFEEFKEKKDEYTGGALPVLLVDGEPLAESNAQLLYVGRLGGLVPTSALAEAKALPACGEERQSGQEGSPGGA